MKNSRCRNCSMFNHSWWTSQRSIHSCLQLKWKTPIESTSSGPFWNWSKNTSLFLDILSNTPMLFSHALWSLKSSLQVSNLPWGRESYRWWSLKKKADVRDCKAKNIVCGLNYYNTSFQLRTWTTSIALFHLFFSLVIYFTLTIQLKLKGVDKKLPIAKHSKAGWFDS